MEQIQAQLEALNTRLVAAEAETRRLRNENQTLVQQTVNSRPHISQALTELTAARTTPKPPPLLGGHQGPGTTPNYSGKEVDWAPWSRKFLNYINAVHPFCLSVFEWAEERASKITKGDLDSEFGDGADVSDQVDNLERIGGEVCTLLIQFMTADASDIVSNCGPG